MRLPEDFLESPHKFNNSVIPLSSHLNRLGLSFKAATAIESFHHEENGGIEGMAAESPPCQVGHIE
jgi:hypothetical protein